jgi:uncharacterized protein (DUF1697 family)
MVYVALLRGINVGGNAKIEMSKLRQMFERLGFDNVKTYINSGNVIFENNKHPCSDLVEIIESSITRTFGMKVPVVVRDTNNIQSIIEAIPSQWVNDSVMKTDVLFLRPEIDSPDILSNITINPKLENVIYDHGVLVWNIARDNVSKGNGIKLIGTDIYKGITVRNVNTVRKIAALMG